MKKKVIAWAAIIVVTLLVMVISFAIYNHISPLSWGMHGKVNQAVFSDEAINGYDPVAYFTQNKAVKGVRNFSYKWNGATWYFSSRNNLNAFKNNPGSYAPQFGGYCAYAVSKGFTANTDPNAFKVIDGKLYLCADQKYLKEWLKDGEENLKKSQGNWK